MDELHRETLDKLSKNLSELSSKFSELTGRSCLISWGFGGPDATYAGICPSKDLTWPDAAKIAVSICGELSEFYGNSSKEDDSDLPPLSPEELDYYKNLPDKPTQNE